MSNTSETKRFKSYHKHVNKAVVKSLIFAAGFRSAKEFAESIGLTASGLNNIIDNRRPHSKEVIRIAKALGVSERRITIRVPFSSSLTTSNREAPVSLAAAQE